MNHKKINDTKKINTRKEGKRHNTRSNTNKLRRRKHKSSKSKNKNKNKIEINNIRKLEVKKITTQERVQIIQE